MRKQNFKQYNEAFDKPYKWWLDYTSNDYIEYIFKTDEGQTYHVIFVPHGEGENSYTGVSFENEHGDMQVNHTGDAFRVFATIMDILYKKRKDLLEQGSVKFAANIDEPSRIKLYDRMVKKFAKKIGYKNVKKLRASDEMNYELSN